MSERKRGVIWFRVSSKGQLSGCSLDAQERSLDEHATKSEIEIERKFRIQESAKNSELRRNFHEMVALVKDKALSLLISYDVDRLARNYTDFYTIQNLIDEHNVTVVITSENKIINKDSGSNDRFFFQIQGAMAEAEWRKNSERTKRGMKEKALQGGLPRYAPEGYQNIADPNDPEPDIKKKRRIIVLESDAKVALIKLAFELYASGRYSFETLRAELNHKDYRTKATSRRSADKAGSPVHVEGPLLLRVDHLQR